MPPPEHATATRTTAAPGALADVLPLGAQVGSDGHLILAGCDVVDLVREYGTPLYVIDEPTLRAACRAWRDAFDRAYPGAKTAYAAKAFLTVPIGRMIAEEGLGVDVASAGELQIALHAGFAPEDVFFHGNNKGAEELALAVEKGIGAIVVDNLHELELLKEIVASGPSRAVRVMVRVNPDVDPHTHAYISTGTLDSKFGTAISTGEADELVRRALDVPGLDMLGLHFHLGSQLFETEPFDIAVQEVLSFAADMTARHGLDLRVFSPGGGFGVRYRDEAPLPPHVFADTIAKAVTRNLPTGTRPKLVLEIGRSIAARAGVALYSVGVVKRIPGVRNYVAVDGGMSDNIRHPLYGTEYYVALANRMHDEPNSSYRVVGKYCESGDILVPAAELPPPTAGDVLTVPMCGAYTPAMASNYNIAMKPAVVAVRDGTHRLLRRRERLEDLMALDAPT